MSSREHHRARYLLLAVVLILSAWTVVAHIDPPEAVGHYGSGPHCSTISSSSHSPGTYTCHNHEPDYYLTTSKYVTCVQYISFNICTELHYLYRYCRRSRPSTARCGSAPLGYVHVNTTSRGPLAGDDIDGSVTIPTPTTTAPPDDEPTDTTPTTEPPDDEPTDTTPPDDEPTDTTPTTAPPDDDEPTDTTTTTAPPDDDEPASPYCSGGHRHSTSGACHGHVAPVCGWYWAISGWGHQWTYTGTPCSSTAPPPPPPPAACPAAPPDSVASTVADRLQWRTALAIDPNGPGPAHPQVPGGGDYLIVDNTPVWPTASGNLDVVDPRDPDDPDDDCAWTAQQIISRATERVPWNDQTLLQEQFPAVWSRWSGLTAARRAAIEASHTPQDVTSSCPVEDPDPQTNCAWSLPEPGVWSWSISVAYLNDDSENGELAAAAGHSWFQPIEAHTKTHTTTGAPNPN